MDVTIITAKHNSQFCLYVAVLFLSLQTTYKSELKMTFAIHVKAWRAEIYYRSTHFYIQHWTAVSVKFDGPAALPPKQEPP
jgi:hypothetical protein